MKRSAVIFLFIALVCTSIFAEEKERYLIVPGVCVGTITENTTEFDLIEQFGVENIRSTTKIDNQNVTITETILFPFDTMKQLHIFWTNGNSRLGPDFIRIEGSSTYWHTAEDITIGTTLLKLEELNGTYFHLTGFNPVNPGEVTDCGYGMLKFLGYLVPDEEDIKGKSIILRLEQPGNVYSRVTPDEYQSICKDEVYNSDNPVMHKLNPLVRQIDVVFP